MRVRFWAMCLTVCAMLASTKVSIADDLVETASKTKGFSTLVAAVKAAGLVDALKGKDKLTVFAPTDDAFAKLPKATLKSLLKPENKDQLKAILTYHVVPGKVTARNALKLDFAKTLQGQRISIDSELGRLEINESNVVATDIACDNGIIHVIDEVLLPSEQSIPEVAKAAGNFSTLLAAVSTAELAETLSGKGPFTVFAPTDEAFEKLPKGTVAELLKPKNRKKLVDILTYHVVPGRIYSDQAIESEQATTVQGQNVKIGLSATGIRINESSLVAVDIQASNGVIHVIDQVLLPESLDENGTMKLLEDAVSKGARAFNHGDFHDCCDVYLSTCKKIVSQGDSLPEEVPAVLEISLKRAKGKMTEKERAWVLRHGIDLAFYALTH